MINFVGIISNCEFVLKSKIGKRFIIKLNFDYVTYLYTTIELLKKIENLGKYTYHFILVFKSVFGICIYF